MLYHGGASGFRPGDIVEPHEGKKVDDCPWCKANADDSHRPDRVFATTFRLYAKFYASKWVGGSLYIVEPAGETEPSPEDPFDSLHASALRVLKVSERGVVLTGTERRRLQRLWREADRAAGRAQDPEYQVADFLISRQLGMRT